MKNILLSAMAILILGCGAQPMRSFEGKAHNTNRNPTFGYKFKPKDTVYDNATGITYRIDSIDYYSQRPNIHYYYATNLATGGTVHQLVENVLVKNY